MLPELPGVITAAQVSTTGAAIASVQAPSGVIAWSPGAHADPWNHVEAAMALDVAGCRPAAERAYEWLLSRQRADGSWAAAYRGDEVEDPAADANFCAYVAAGAWHHFLSTRDAGFLEDMWPAVERAIEFTLALQTPRGEILWARDASGRPWPGALLSSSSCIHLSLRCALAIADELGHERPRWHTAIERLATVVAARPDAFEDKREYAMDWYYPVLGGAVSGVEAEARIERDWERFVVRGLGVRCVSHRPWVTVAETCELVLTLDALGHAADARRLFSWVHRLRGGDGGYWTGVTFPEGELWPEEQPTWTSAAVLLAADALAGASPAATFFSTDEPLEAAG
jgi:hypothetical protein